MLSQQCTNYADVAEISIAPDCPYDVTHLVFFEPVVAVPEMGHKRFLGEWRPIQPNPLPHLQQVRRTRREEKRNKDRWGELEERRREEDGTYWEGDTW